MSWAYRTASRLLHSGQAVGRQPWRWAMTARGRDVTAVSARRSCLVIAPHPDDETLGCGATIARKVDASSSVWVLIAADGRHSHTSDQISPEELSSLRAAEASAACRVLGVPESHVRQLSMEDSYLQHHVEELSEVISAVVDDLRPEEILVTSARDWHPDHQAVNRAARAALASLADYDGTLYEYPVWHWSDGPWTRHGPRSLSRKLRDVVHEPWDSLTGPRPDLVATGAYLERKREALGCYRSQLENLTGEPTWAVLESTFLAAFLRPHELFLPARQC